MSQFTKSVILENDKIDSSLQELVVEAQTLFQVLDSASEKIRDLEKKLSELKANFPFKYLLREDKKSAINFLEPQHFERNKFQQDHSSLRYYTQVLWYLSWEAAENSKNFRLYLLSTLKETIVWYDGEEVAGIEPYESEVLFRKPLIETDLPTRLQFTEYLHVFISNFKEYLKKYRTAIEGRNLLFSEDELQF